MGVNYGAKQIVRNGLKYCIDGRDTYCYNGSGTSVTNLGSNTIGGGDFGGDTTGSPSNGYFSFDGTGDYILSGGFISTAMLSAGYTFELWGLWTNSEAGGEHQHGCHSGNSPGGRMYLGWYQDKMMVGAGSGYNQVTVGGSQNNKWYYMSQTVDSSGNVVGYLDGTQVVTASGRSFGNSLTDAGTLKITWGGYTSSGNTPHSFAYTNGYLGCGRWYNRPLTSAEITQNFNAQRDRFGV